MPAGQDPAKTEPSAAMREFAKTMREMYAALVLEGFSTSEAIMVIGAVMAASFKGNTDD